MTLGLVRVMGAGVVVRPCVQEVGACAIHMMFINRICPVYSFLSTT